MKNLLLILCLSLYSLALLGQKKTTAYGQLSFEYPIVNPDITLYRDTISNPQNIWQIGRPGKAVLNAAYSPSNVIITDTLNAYPTNDTSAFIIRQRAWYGWWIIPHMNAGLHGYYFVDTDSLTDFGTIDISFDNGQSWINLLNDTLYNLQDSTCSWWSNSSFPKPVLTGRSGGWKPFGFSFCTLADSFHLHFNDTILLRFSFMSDGVQTNKDGLMFDDLLLEDWIETVTNVPMQNAYIAPNPVTDHANVVTSYAYTSLDVSVFDVLGREVYVRRFDQHTPVTIITSELTPGVYNYRLNFDSGRLLHNGRFLKQ